MRHLILAALLLLAFSPFALAAAGPPRVVASISPVHSLTATVMAGVGEPVLLLRGGSSPHSAALRPSEVAALQQADLIVWIGPEMEQFLTRPLRTISRPGSLLTLNRTPGLTLLPAREGGLWGKDHDGHAHAGTDPHIWLDPINAIRMAEAIRDRLISADPDRTETYRRNAEALTARLRQLDQRLRQQLEPVRDLPYVVFHDAYQNFEVRYGLHPAGAISVDPERRPGVRRLRQIREQLLTSRALCLFSEPQFEPRYVGPLTEGTRVRTGVLDPLGSALPPGPELYFELLQQLADSLTGCLAPGTP